MTAQTPFTDDSLRKSILVLSLSKHLHGTPISSGIAAELSKPKAFKANKYFDLVGFDLDPDYNKISADLKRELRERDWDGVLIGWCSRGNVAHTELFESLVGAVVEEQKVKPGLKLVFNTGPENLVEPALRNFPMEGGA
jgi:hypothetical protein